MNSTYPNPKVNKLFDTLALAGFDGRDFADLAAACLDQSDKVDVFVYERVVESVGEHMTPVVFRGKRGDYPSRGYYPVIFVSPVSMLGEEGQERPAVSVDFCVSESRHHDGCEVVIPDGKDADEVVGAVLRERWGVELPPAQKRPAPGADFDDAARGAGALCL